MQGDTDSSAALGPPAAYYHVGEPGRKISHTIDYGGGLLVDVDKNGYAIGIETIGDIKPETAYWRIATETRLRP